MCNCNCPYGSFPACRARRGDRPCALEEAPEDGGYAPDGEYGRLGVRQREEALRVARGRLARPGQSLPAPEDSGDGPLPGAEGGEGRFPEEEQAPGAACYCPCCERPDSRVYLARSGDTYRCPVCGEAFAAYALRMKYLRLREPLHNSVRVLDDLIERLGDA